MKAKDNIVVRRRTRSSKSEKSEYEIYRENKISRNREHLKRLGLDKPILSGQDRKRRKKSAPENTKTSKDNIIVRRRTRSSKTEKSEYEIYRENKISRNREHLKRLGLDKPILSGQERKRIKKSAPKISHTPRRSSRLLNANDPVSSEEVRELDEETSSETLPPPRRKRVSFRIQNPPTTEERKKLKNIKTEEVLNDVAYYMHVHLKNSEMNIKNVKKTLTKLFNGEGVMHQSSRRKGHVFKQGVRISLADNICELLDEASDWIDFHGRDVSNGWLVRHPLGKLLLYQIARIENGEAFSHTN